MGTHPSTTEYTVLVTGASGFLGRHIVGELLDSGSPVPIKALRALDLIPFPDNVDSRITRIQGDILDKDLVSEACGGVDLVIHAAAIVDWGTRSGEEVLAINYKGTLNLLEACRANGVRSFLYTSSLDVLVDGRPLTDVNESTPYPSRHANMYCKSKYLAEKAVTAANGNGLATSSLRPSDIYGEGDPYHIDSLINMARAGFYVRLGDGKAKCQHVYVGNMAHAHVLLARQLLDGSEAVRGQSYFITDGPGANFFTFFDSIVEGAGYRIWPGNLWLPRWLAHGIGAASEFVALLVRPIKRYNPKMSRFAVSYTCTDFTFTADKAKKDFGYTPKYEEGEALERTVAHYKRMQ